MQGVPDLSIVVVNRNTRRLLLRALDTVGQEVGDLSAEIFVVDNASTDGSAGMVREQFPAVRVLENAENVGFARANNQAIRSARGRYVLLLNSDTELLPGALDAMVRFADSKPLVGACGPMLLNSDGSLQVSCQPMITPEREFWRLMFLDRVQRRASYDVMRWDSQVPRQVEVLKGACLMLRQEAITQVGLLDERFFMYTEEVDLCYRLLESGWEVWWVPQARVVHHGGASTGQVKEEMYLELYRSKAQFYRKVGGVRLAERFRRLMRMAYVPRCLVLGLGAWLRPEWRARARVYRRLLAELPAM